MNDIDERVPLEPLDPGTLNPGFWVRFHARVLDQAQMELARRRVNGDLTFADVVFAITDWSPERRFLGPFRDVFEAP